jgi:hypothetical protein
MHVEIGTEATQFPEKEYLNGIFVDMHVISSPCVYEPARYCFSTFYRANVSLWPCVIVPTSELLSKCVTMPPCYCGHLLPWLCDHTAKKIWNKYSQKRNFHIHVFLSDIQYMFPWLICLFCCRKNVYWSWEYVNRSQTHACGNWDWGSSIPRKGIPKWDFPCSVRWREEGGRAWWQRWWGPGGGGWSQCRTGTGPAVQFNITSTIFILVILPFLYD